MFINGKNRSNPVLLWVHGGPGMPDYFLLERYPTGLEDVFTVVWWDQRGTGLSYGSDIPPATMTVEQFIADTLAVTDYLRWEQIIRVDLTTTVPNLELPVYFFHGAYDYTCSYPLAEEYLRTLTAPLKGSTVRWLRTQPDPGRAALVATHSDMACAPAWCRSRSEGELPCPRANT
jgi:pimeloyl-ACP methyl ester carboxylesterase